MEDAHPPAALPEGGDFAAAVRGGRHDAVVRLEVGAGNQPPLNGHEQPWRTHPRRRLDEPDHAWLMGADDRGRSFVRYGYSEAHAAESMVEQLTTDELHHARLPAAPSRTPSRSFTPPRGPWGARGRGGHGGSGEPPGRPLAGDALAAEHRPQ
eukprot:5818262-Alexandrium_andersonii.AAC.1